MKSSGGSSGDSHVGYRDRGAMVPDWADHPMRHRLSGLLCHRHVRASDSGEGQAGRMGHCPVIGLDRADHHSGWWLVPRLPLAAMTFGQRFLLSLAITLAVLLG